MTSGSARFGSASAFPTTRHYGWLALGFLAFAVYGSLVPLDCRPLAIGEAIDRYRAAWQVPIRVESRSDWLSNILLFIPLGFLVSGWLAVDRPRRAILAAVLAVPAASVMASAAIEFAQVYFPSRTVSPRDVVAETVGGAIGGALWLAAGPWLTRRARARASNGGGLAAWLLPAYLLALILSHVMPLDITISPGELYHKYKEGMICPVPFSAAARGFVEFERRIVDEAASFLVVGLFLGRSDPWRARGPWSLLSLGLVLAGTIEALQLFIASRRCDSTDVIVGGLAVLGGWAAGRATLPTAARQARLACFAGWLGLVAFSSWFPFDFVADPRFWLDKASKVTALPFADYYHGSVWNAADQIFRKAVLFFPLGMVSDRGWRGTLLAASGLAILFEVGQLGLPGREPSVTDVLIEIGGAWAGLSLGGLRPSTHRDGVEY
jgi:VanZ family protein